MATTDAQRDALIAEAIDLAIDGVRAGRGGPFGAIVARNGRVVGRGESRVTSDNDPTAHAEIVAIRAACASLGTFDLTGHDLFASCEPCPMCLAAAYWARLERIYYAATREDAAVAGFDDERFYSELGAPASKRSLPTTRLAVPQAREPFAAWAGKPDKIRY